MIERFNFYDVYGYLIPGVILFLVGWLPFGLASHELPPVDLFGGVIALIVAYVLGHLLQVLARLLIPSKFAGVYPSDRLMRPDDRTLSSDAKTRLQTLAVSKFGLGQGDSDRPQLFLLCRSSLVFAGKGGYVEQFEGLYTLLRGCALGFGLGSVYLLGWTATSAEIVLDVWPHSGLLLGCLVALSFLLLTWLRSPKQEAKRKKKMEDKAKKEEEEAKRKAEAEKRQSKGPGSPTVEESASTKKAKVKAKPASALVLSIPLCGTVLFAGAAFRAHWNVKFDASWAPGIAIGLAIGACVSYAGYKYFAEQFALNVYRDFLAFFGGEGKKDGGGEMKK